MRVVYLKKNDFKEYNFKSLDGYTFNPRNKNISSLRIVKEDFIKFILSKKVKREISKVRRAIKLMAKSDITIESDCDLMIGEVIKITKKLDIKYRCYFKELYYFDLIKDLYVLFNIINYKKKILDA